MTEDGQTQSMGEEMEDTGRQERKFERNAVDLHAEYGGQGL